MRNSLRNTQTGKYKSPIRKPGPQPGQRAPVRLVTMGDVLREMSRTYNAAVTGKPSGRISMGEMTKRFWSLRATAATIAEAERLGIDATKDDDARPMFSGLVVKAPDPARLPMLAVIDGQAVENPPRKGNGHDDGNGPGA